MSLTGIPAFQEGLHKPGRLYASSRGEASAEKCRGVESLSFRILSRSSDSSGERLRQLQNQLPMIELGLWRFPNQLFQSRQRGPANFVRDANNLALLKPV